MARVAAEQEHPRLHIRSPFPAWWTWEVTAPGGEVLDDGHTTTWAAALAIGLDALETASRAGSGA